VRLHFCPTGRRCSAQDKAPEEGQGVCALAACGRLRHQVVKSIAVIGREEEKEDALVLITLAFCLFVAVTSTLCLFVFCLNFSLVLQEAACTVLELVSFAHPLALY